MGVWRRSGQRLIALAKRILATRLLAAPLVAALFLPAATLSLLAAPVTAAETVTASAVVMLYHRFGESAYPSTNVTIEQFEAHLAEIAEGGYTVLPLPRIVAAITSGETLPEKTLALTVDDAFLSVYEEAWPRLREAGLSFTLFVSTGPVDGGYEGLMNWDQIRELAAAGVTIGNHTVDHGHMPPADSEKNRANIADANARFEAELGFRPNLFAYPYGEFGLTQQDLAREAGFDAAFGQHSGVVYTGINMFALPRFALNEKYAGLDRFRLAANALPLPMSEITPADTIVTVNPPPFGFTVGSGIARLDRLSCFYSHEGEAADIERLGEHRFEVRASAPLPAGRSRVNCTVPGPGGRWRWNGTQFYTPKP